MAAQPPQPPPDASDALGDGDDPASRPPRRSRHKLRTPDLTSMAIPDEQIPPADASASAAPNRAALAPEAPTSATPAPAPDGAGRSAPPGSSADVDVMLDTTNTVSVPPPPRTSVPPPRTSAAPPPSEASSPSAPPGAMRVRRRVRMIGQDDAPSSPTPAPVARTSASADGLHIPSAAVPHFSEAPADGEHNDTEPAPPLLVSELPAPVEAPSAKPAPGDGEASPAPAPSPAEPPSPPPAVAAPSAEAPAARRPSNPPPPLPRRASTPPPSPAAVARPVSGAAAPSAPLALPDVPAVPALPAPPPLPAMSPRASAEPAAAKPATPADDDESVDVSLEEGDASPHGKTSVDPSLAMLDELAEMSSDSHAELLDPEAIEHVEAPAPRGASMPPPPPRDARGNKSSTPPSAPPAVKITSGTTAPDAKARRRRMWWEELFSEDYFRTMERLTPPQVAAEVDWIEHALGVEAGASILDVACGPGRQAIELARRRYEVVGVDLSVAMLTRAAEAAQEAGLKVGFTQCDMAAMEFSESFDAAYCVGSSFGFFDDGRNAEVARRIHRALKPHGTLLLGVLNRDHAIQRQPAMAWFEGDGCVCMEESSFNFITSRLNVKRTMIFDDGRQREFEYSVRLYSLHELGQVLHDAGFRILEVSGHARTPGAFFGPSSRELIILAQKRGSEVVDLGGDAFGANATDSSRP